MSNEEGFKYNAAGLLDEAIKTAGVKNDAALARALDIAPPALSKVRNNNMPVGPSLVLKMHERLGMPVATIRTFIGGQP